LIVIINFDVSFAQQPKVVSSYGPINQDVGFDQIKADRMKVKAERAKEHMTLLNNRYNLSKNDISGCCHLTNRILKIQF
jgi:hypothetical protein